MFKRISIRQRIVLLTGFLVFLVVLTSSAIFYIGAREAAMQVGRERLLGLTGQLGTMFQQSAQTLQRTTHNAVDNEAIRTCLHSMGKDSVKESLRALSQLGADTLTVLVELFDSDGKLLINRGKLPASKFLMDSFWTRVPTEAGSTAVGSFYKAGDSLYYPIISTITDKEKLLGYVIRWRCLTATPKAIGQLSQLLGAGATLYFGNREKNIWTDMMKAVAGPPDVARLNQGTMNYSRPGSGRVLAAMQEVPDTKWLILVEFSEQKILETANRFIVWLLVAGVILVLLGIIVAWAMGRKITEPIKRLTIATEAMADGNYTEHVDVERQDELGKLALAFNKMAMNVQEARAMLERKVKERTLQLETSNKELEAFSYSVSHDLRAPLRIINGYTEIMSNDYATILGDEGKRMLDIVSYNAKRMGVLIDDLLNFSRLGRQEMTAEEVDMKATLESVIIEQMTNSRQEVDFRIGKLSNVKGDERLLRQVWMNLISNAIKYSSTRERSIIEVESETQGNEIQFCISDNGVGFDMTYAGKLFGVFQRLHKATEFEGTGIGLALVQRIIDRHGGRVWAESSRGEGARFYFSLPA